MTSDSKRDELAEKYKTDHAQINNFPLTVVSVAFKAGYDAAMAEKDERVNKMKTILKKIVKEDPNLYTVLLWHKADALLKEMDAE